MGGYASKQQPGIRVARTAQLAGLPLACVATGAAGFAGLRATDAAWSVGAGLAMAVGLASFYTAMARGSIGVSAAVAATVGAVLPLAVGVAGGEDIGLITAAGLVAALTAVIAVSLAPSDGNASTVATSVALAAGAGACFGAFNVCLAQTSAKGGLAPVAIERATAAVALVALSMLQRSAADAAVRRWAFAIPIGVLEVAGTIALIEALRQGPLGIASVLASLYPVVTIVLAFVFAGERLSPQQRLGLASAVASVALLAIR